MTGPVQELFHQLADLSSEERDRYWADHRVDVDLRRQAEALLAYDTNEHQDLDGSIRTLADVALARWERQPQRCGPFRLRQVIGRGGMGVVYLGERADGEVRQQVAVKLLGPGLGHLQADRFLREREILAGLSHPHIAHLLDAGHTDDGQAFLAMEYVEGRPFDEYAAPLADREKIQLFLKVCAAVAYLHRNLVVHCDLKPGNILVTADGEPKVLDFGIAKILEPRAEGDVTNLRMLTPDYASPEQLAGGRVGTPSDIYSLAAVLQKILAHPAKGDLQFILLRALRPKPQDRYATVEQFSEDLAAYLESRPIRARQGEWAYQARKFAQRYWLPIAAALLTIAGLGTGLLVANRERALAERRFADVRSLANRLFDIDAQVRQLPGATKTRQLIVDTATEYLSKLAQDRGRDPGLDLDLGTAYLRVARVQGVPISINLGQTAEAERHLRIGEQWIAGVLARPPAQRLALLRAAQIAHDRMILAQARRPSAPATPLARQAEEWLLQYLAAGAVTAPAEAADAVIVGTNVANWYIRQNLFEDGLRLLHTTAELAKATGQTRQLGTIQIVVARACRSRGDLDGALAAIREGVRVLSPGSADVATGPRKAYQLALSTEAAILGAPEGISLGRPDEARPLLERGLAITREMARADPHDSEARFATVTQGVQLADILCRRNPARALAIYDEVRGAAREIQNNPRARRNEADALVGSTAPLLALGRSAEARQRLEEAFAMLESLKLYPAATVELGSEVDGALRAKAALEAATGKPIQALATARDLLGKVMAAKPEPESNLADAADLALLYLSLAHLEPAADWDTRRMNLWRHWQRQLPHNPFVDRQAKIAR